MTLNVPFIFISTKVYENLLISSKIFMGTHNRYHDDDIKTDTTISKSHCPSENRLKIYRI